MFGGAAVGDYVDCVEALGDVGVEGAVGDVIGDHVAAVCVAAVGKYAVPAGVAVVGILDVETPEKVVDFHCAAVGAGW